MNRRGFLKGLLGGAAAVALAPVVKAAEAVRRPKAVRYFATLFFMRGKGKREPIVFINGRRVESGEPCPVEAFCDEERFGFSYNGDLNWEDPRPEFRAGIEQALVQPADGPFGGGPFTIECVFKAPPRRLWAVGDDWPRKVERRVGRFERVSRW